MYNLVNLSTHNSHIENRKANGTPLLGWVEGESTNSNCLLQLI